MKVKLDDYEVRVLINGLIQQHRSYDAETNGQEVLCSEECKTINRNQRQLAYYHRKQSAQNAGEAI